MVGNEGMKGCVGCGGKSELKQYAGIDLSAGEIVGHGVLLVGDVGYPKIRVDVVDAEKVEAVNAYPNVAEWRLAFTLLVVERTIAHAYVGTLVGR